MKIELKNITHNERLSEETNAYAASLYVDGKRIGEVSNDGHGGCDMFRGDQKAYGAADAWCKENLPRMAYEGQDLGPTDLESHCGDLLTNWLCERDMKRVLRSKVIFKLESDHGLRELSFKGCRKLTSAHMASARQKVPAGAVILNDLPENDALKIWMQR